MKDNTLRGELMRITKESASTQVGFDEYSQADYPKMIDQLEALLAKEVRKAKLEEVNRISRYVEIRNTADGATISAEYLYRQAKKRIKQLEKEGK